MLIISNNNLNNLSCYFCLNFFILTMSTNNVNNKSVQKSNESQSYLEDSNFVSTSDKQTNHLVLCLGSELISAYCKSTFAISYDREQALAPPGPLACASRTANHHCQKHVYPQLDQQTICKLFEQMPNVTKLELRCAVEEITDFRLDDSLTDSVISLIEHWAESILTLRLWFQYGPSNLADLVTTINQLSLLKHLTLEIVENSSPFEILDLSILSRLEEFFFSYPIFSEKLLELLAKYAVTNTKLKRISLRIDKGITEQDINTLKRIILNIATCVIQLPEIHRPFKVDTLNSFFVSFHSLTSLDIDCASLSLAVLANCLAPLNSLIILRLLNAFAQLERSLVVEDQSFTTDNIARLSSILCLTIELFATSHNTLHSDLWSWVFPSVQEVVVTNHATNCAICDRASLTGLSKPSMDTKIECIRMLMAPLKKCSCLKKTAPVDIVSARDEYC